MRGSSSRSGPAPDPNALRRERKSDQAGWTHLPAAGRQGDAPAWPLTRATARELALWAREWRRPQAVMWEANDQHLEVAIYVRSLRDAERPKATTAARQLLKQQMEALGISIPGLRANRWIIAELDEKPVRQPRVIEGGQSVRDRLKDVAGGGV